MNLRVGDALDCMDTDDKWCVAEVTAGTAEQIMVHCKHPIVVFSPIQGWL